MRMNRWQMLRNCSLVVSMAMAGGVVLAEKPDWAGSPGGQGKHKNKNREERQEYRAEGTPSRQGVDIRIGAYFGDGQRMEVNNYYREQSRGGHCPPGLAKKNNGCMPPGQARKWGVGRALPAGVVYYPVEPSIQVRLGTAPAGHKFVRVAADILLIAVGTGMVVDAMQDLGR